MILGKKPRNTTNGDQEGVLGMYAKWSATKNMGVEKYGKCSKA